MTYKLIVTDLDGTLLNSQHKVSPRTCQTLKAAMAQGIEVILATGRPRTNTVCEVIEQLGLSTPGIFLQGGIIHHADGRLVHETHLHDNIAANVISLAEQAGYSVMAYVGQEILTGRRDQYTDMVIEYNEPVPQVIGSLHHTGRAINKLVFFDEPDRIPIIRTNLEALLNGSAKLVQTLASSIEVIPLDTSKGNALRWLLKEHYNLPADDVIAFGDAENDVEMLQVAGFGVAMQNAMPVTKAAADYITGSNDDDGVAVAVEKFILKRR